MRVFFIAAIALFLNLNIASAALEGFSDRTAIPDWAHSSIATLSEKEVMSGNSDGTFAPDRPMNRAEFCKVLVQATGVEKYLPLESSFPDVERSDWFFDYVETAHEYGWLEGYPDGTFQPGSKINRAEAAKIMANAFGLEVAPEAEDEPWYKKYFRTLLQKELLPHGAEYTDLKPNHNPTRSEIAEQLFRIMKKTGHLTSFDIVQADDVPEPNQTENSNSAPESFTYQSPETIQTLPAEQDAGTLYIYKDESLPKKKTVSKNQRDVIAHQLKLQSKNGIVELAGLQFRRVGNGIYSDFNDLWLEEAGRRISDRIHPYKELIHIPLKQTRLAIGSSIKKITLKVDMSQTAKSGNNSRWVLHIPEWIDANTEKKVGFFPFGGISIEVV